MNKYCSTCNKEFYLFDFKTNDYFCESCSSNKILELSCKIITDLANCNEIFENYRWIKDVTGIGGIHGYKYIVYNKILNEETFLKVQPYAVNDSMNEMNISCLVSKYTNFVTTYNAWICDKEPVDKIWKESKISEEYSDDYNPKLYYIEMKKYSGTFKDLLISDTPLYYHDQASICYELFNSLKIANDELGFIHGDFNYGNIFYHYNNEPRIYEIETINEFKKRTTLNIKCTSEIVPIWGDFGKSTLRKGKFRTYYYNKDIEKESTECQEIIFKMIDESFPTVRRVIPKTLWTEERNVTNQQVLVLLGKIVNAAQIQQEKRQRLKNQIQ
jgi:hypothetical protein